MNSELLNQIGLGFIDAGYILMGLLVLIVILFIIIIIQSVNLGKVNRKYQKFMQGKDALSLEKSVLNLYESNRVIKDQTEINRKNIREISNKQKYAFQKFGLVKYDAFKQMGGELSFCLVMLNDKKDGYIINNVHGAEGSYTYSKEIKNGICNVVLGDEENQALKKALK